MRNHQQ